MKVVLSAKEKDALTGKMEAEGTNRFGVRVSSSNLVCPDSLGYYMQPFHPLIMVAKNSLAFGNLLPCLRDQKNEEAPEGISSSANRKLGLGSCCFLSATKPDGRSDEHD